MAVAIKSIKRQVPVDSTVSTDASAESNGSAAAGGAQLGSSAASDPGHATALAELRHEAEMLARVCHHRHLVEFVGIVPERLCVVTVFAENGSLEDLFLKDGGKRADDLLPTEPIAKTRFLLGLALQAASGIRHLHSESVIHRDLAARNMLVDDRLNVRVADFGFARLKEESRSKGYTSSDMVRVRND